MQTEPSYHTTLWTPYYACWSKTAAWQRQQAHDLFTTVGMRRKEASFIRFLLFHCRSRKSIRQRTDRGRADVASFSASLLCRSIPPSLHLSFFVFELVRSHSGEATSLQALPLPRCLPTYASSSLQSVICSRMRTTLWYMNSVRQSTNWVKI